MSLDLKNFVSDCEPKQKLIVSEECGREHRANNINRNNVRHFRVDGKIIIQRTACDFLLLNDTKKKAYFIELKGSDAKHGVEQLVATAKEFKNQLSGYDFFYRLILSRSRSHEIQSHLFQKFKKEHKKSFIYQNDYMEEDI